MLSYRKGDEFWTFYVPLLLTAETRKEIAGTVTYLTVLSTSVTIVFSSVLRTTRDTQRFIEQRFIEITCIQLVCCRLTREGGI